MAGELEREGLRLPLLIGGATTSHTHTAVRVAPVYSGPTVHVLDASRAAGVVSALLDEAGRDEYVAGVRAEYEAIRVARAERGAREARHPLAEARRHRMRIDWAATEAPVPAFLGVREVEPALEALVERIDWSPFFAAWELNGGFPAILDDPVNGARGTGPAPRRAARCWSASWPERLLRPHGVVGFWPAASTADDDIVLYTDETRNGIAAVVHTLRQQMVKADGRPNVALADFTAPTGSGVARPRRRIRRDRRPRARRARGRVRGGSRRLLARSSPRLSPTGSPRPSPSGSTRTSAASCGATRRTRRSTTTALIARALPGHPPGAGLPGLPGPHREAHAVRAARRRDAGGHRAHRDLRDAARRRRSRASTSGIPRRATSGSAGSAATSSPTTPGARG